MSQFDEEDPIEPPEVVPLIPSRGNNKDGVPSAVEKPKTAVEAIFDDAPASTPFKPEKPEKPDVYDLLGIEKKAKGPKKVSVDARAASTLNSALTDVRELVEASVALTHEIQGVTERLLKIADRMNNLRAALSPTGPASSKTINESGEMSRVDPAMKKEKSE